MAKAFASQGDLTEKKTSFVEIGEGLWAFTAEGDPNTGVIIGDDSVMVVEAQATPRLARKVIDCIRGVTDKPISHLVLTHYHAVRVLGAKCLRRRAGHHVGCRAGHGGRARARGLGQRVRPLSAPLPGARRNPRPDLADHDLLGCDDGLSGQTAGRHHAPWPCPYGRGCGGLGARRRA
jgi:glyoxylase-like metal-dependent hydrolase (beta-lactamase superfamily II)